MKQAQQTTTECAQLPKILTLRSLYWPVRISRVTLRTESYMRLSYHCHFDEELNCKKGFHTCSRRERSTLTHRPSYADCEAYRMDGEARKLVRHVVWTPSLLQVPRELYVLLKQCIRLKSLGIRQDAESIISLGLSINRLLAFFLGANQPLQEPPYQNSHVFRCLRHRRILHGGKRYKVSNSTTDLFVQPREGFAFVISSHRLTEP